MGATSLTVAMSLVTSTTRLDWEPADQWFRIYYDMMCRNLAIVYDRLIMIACINQYMLLVSQLSN